MEQIADNQEIAQSCGSAAFERRHDALSTQATWAFAVASETQKRTSAMASGILGVITELTSVDLFATDPSTGVVATGDFVGHPFHIDYEKANLLVADAWKAKAKGLPQGSFLLAYYENEDQVYEALLLRVLKPAPLPTDRDVIASMVEYYKDNLKTSGKSSQLDQYTRYEFSFSGLECRILGTFYRDGQGRTLFGADLENFYSAHHYRVLKPRTDVLEFIVNFRDGASIVGKPNDFRIGKVRYSSSRRFQTSEPDVPVWVSPQDFLGKRTAMFGMTRTGKSNTVKKIIESTMAMSDKAKGDLSKAKVGNAMDTLPFNSDGVPRYPVGQIIFDINGEYANPNLQDEGTAIYELFQDDVLRYSTLEKQAFKVMKVNFFNDIQAGFELVCSHLATDTGDYIASFRSIDMTPPAKDADESTKVRYARKCAAYLCCLYRAGFEPPAKFKLTFSGNKELNVLVQEDGKIDPAKGISADDAVAWFGTIWDAYDDNDFFTNYKKKKGYEWADEDLKAILKMLTRKPKPGGNASVSGYLKLRDLKVLHTPTVDRPFAAEIGEHLRAGKIVIVDLSQGDTAIQQLYSERICQQIFADAMNRFVSNIPNNFVQFYFEEAHNLFPKKDDKDLSQIYNRLAKEGAKLNIGLVYATQEVSSISANILKNTQNWFIAHLNNEDETREIQKYYDFGDFTEGLVRFSAGSDKGFVRMKTYSNPFVVPVQVDRFAKTG